MLDRDFGWSGRRMYLCLYVGTREIWKQEFSYAVIFIIYQTRGPMGLDAHLIT